MIRAATPLPTRTPPLRPTPAPAPAPVTPSREELAANAAERRARGEEVSADEEEEAVPLVAVPPAVVSSGSASGWNIVPTSEKVIRKLFHLSSLHSTSRDWILMNRETVTSRIDAFCVDWVDRDHL